MQTDPDKVARYCDWPVNHADLCARKLKINKRYQELLQNLIADDKYFDAEIAGYYIWASCCWIGAGLTSPNQIPHIGKKGMGVHAIGQMQNNYSYKDVREPYNDNIYIWFRKLSERLRRVRVVCGDWSRVCGGNWQNNLGSVGIFFDPPYSHDTGRDTDIYCQESSEAAKQVSQWCSERGDNPDYRIVLAGYDGEHNHLEKKGWTVVRWKTGGGYGKISGKKITQGKINRNKEILWLSPHCLKINLF